MPRTFVYQPLYLNQKGDLVAVGGLAFPTRDEAQKFGEFVAKRGQRVSVLAVELMEGK